MVLKGHPQQVPFLLCKGAGMSPVENIIHRHKKRIGIWERKNDTRYLCAGTQKCIMKTMATRGGAAVKNVHKTWEYSGLMSVLSVAANAQWVKTSGPWSGDASCLQCHYATALAASGGTVVAGTYAGGVFLSLDNGTSWTGIDSASPMTAFFPLPRAAAVFLPGPMAAAFSIPPITARSGPWPIRPHQPNCPFSCGERQQLFLPELMAAAFPFRQ